MTVDGMVLSGDIFNLVERAIVQHKESRLLVADSVWKFFLDDERKRLCECAVRYNVDLVLITVYGETKLDKISHIPDVTPTGGATHACS